MLKTIIYLIFLVTIFDVKSVFFINQTDTPLVLLHNNIEIVKIDLSVVKKIDKSLKDKKVIFAIDLRPRRNLKPFIETTLFDVSKNAIYIIDHFGINYFSASVHQLQPKSSNRLQILKDLKQTVPVTVYDSRYSRMQ